MGNLEASAETRQSVQGYENATQQEALKMAGRLREMNKSGQLDKRTIAEIKAALDDPTHCEH